MRYIVIDLEFNGRNQSMIKPFEIIEIGATALDADLKIQSQFQRFVKPLYVVNDYALCFSGIDHIQIEQASHFNEVFLQLKKYLGKDYILVFWSVEDLEILIEESKRHGIRKEWLRKSIVMQNHLPLNYKKNTMGLKEACEFYGIRWEGRAHRASDDSYNTAKLFIQTFKVYNLTIFESIEYNPTRGILKNTLKRLIKERMLHNGEILTWQKFSQGKTMKKIVMMYRLNKGDIKQLEKLFYRITESIIERELSCNESWKSMNEISIK